MECGGSRFFTLYRSIYYFLVASETKRLYRILGVVKKKKRTQKSGKSSGPKHDDANILRHRHFVEVQDFRMEGLQILC